MNRRNFFKSLVGAIAAAAILGETPVPKVPWIRFCPSLVTQLIEVQPLDGPCGQIFYMSYSYGATRKA